MVFMLVADSRKGQSFKDQLCKALIKMSRIGLAFLQTLQGLSSKEEVLRIHREKEGLSREKADTIWLHYLEFMVVKAHHGDSSGKKMKFSTTPEIDALWHTHLLNT